ncbi:MAG: C_GCAxxG_C_C family protein [Bacteroidales bacterium]|nr:C_GCAxxG_C_C family protein [Bacteroidales bacterium]
MNRRDFSKRGLIAAAAIGTAGIGSYLLYSKKGRTLNNYYRMGHCAPTVMQTLVDVSRTDYPGLVLYTGAMSGGIAGPGMECGVLTAPLIYMGYKNKTPAGLSGKLDLIRRGQTYITRFDEFNGTCICGNIRQGGAPACRRAVGNFYRIYSGSVEKPDVLTDEVRKSYSLLLSEFESQDFHCAHNVLKSLKGEFRAGDEMHDASWLLVGGLAMLNRTCGALAAGVMAVSSLTAKVEKSYFRVAKMNRFFRENNNSAMDEQINNFNRSIRLSEVLGTWFRSEFGSTTCYDICGANFSLISDAESYLSGNFIVRCSDIAKRVAEKVNSMI